MGWKKIKCPECHGTGRATCPSCNGKQRELITIPIVWGDHYRPYLREGEPEPKEWRNCSKCNALGNVQCPKCEGRGELMIKSAVSTVSVVKELPKAKYPYEIDYESPSINPNDIDREFFYKETGDAEMEFARQTILEAFNEVDARPYAYKFPLKIRAIHFPEYGKYSDMTRISVADVIWLSSQVGNHMGNWVEISIWCALLLSEDKFLEQWKRRCRGFNEVIWKNGYMRHYGSFYRRSNIPMTIRHGNMESTEKFYLNDARPLVVVYE